MSKVLVKKTDKNKANDNEFIIDNFELKSHSINNNICSFNLAILNSISQTILVIDKNFKTMFVNDNAKTLLGYNSKELLKKDIYAKIFKTKSTENDKTNYFYYETIKRGKEIKIEEVLVKNKFNKWLYLTLTSKPLFDKGEIIGAVVSIDEITNLIENKNKYYKELENIKKYIEYTDSLIIITDSNGIIQQANKNFSNLFINSYENIIGENLNNLLVDSQRKIISTVSKKIISGIKINEELLFFNTANSVKILSCQFSHFVKSNNNVFIIINGKDISKEYETTQRNVIYNKIIKNIKEPVAIINDVYEYFYVNEAYANLFNKTINQVTGEKVSEFLGQKLFEGKLKKLYNKCFKGENVHYESWFEFIPNRKIYLSINYYPIVDENKKIKFIIANSRDLSESKLMEENILARKEYYKSLIEKLPIPTVIINKNKFELLNKAALDLLEIKNNKLKIEDFRSSDISKDLHKQFYNLVLGKNDKKIFQEKIKTIKGKILDIETIIEKIGYEISETYLIAFNDMTLKNQMTIALNSSKELYLSLLDDFPALIWRSDENVNIDYFNNTWLKFTGKKLDEEKNNGWLNSIHPSDKRIVKSFIFQFNRLESFDLSYRLKRFDGEYRWMNNIGKPYYDKNKNFLGFIGVCFDITSRINLELALRESKDKYKRFFADDLSANFVISIDGKLLETNKSFLDLLTFNSIYELEDKTISDFYDNREEVNILIDKIKKDKKVYYYETKMKKRNGQVVDVVQNLVGVFDENEMLYQIRGYINDNTIQKESERKLQKYNENLENDVSERTKSLNELNKKLAIEIQKQVQIKSQLNNKVVFLETLLNAIPNPIYIKNRQRQIIDCNTSYEQFVGLSKYDLLGKSQTDIPDVVFPSEFDLIEQSVIKESGSRSLELKIKKNNELHDYQIIVQTYFLSDESIAGLVGIVFDLSEQKRLQIELKNAFESEKELSDLKSRFISTASHEFRTPLTTILASADLLEMFGKNWDDIKYYEHITKIQNAVVHMTELLDDVLTVSRAETGSLLHNPEEILLNAFIQEIIGNLGYSHLVNYEYKISEYKFNLDKKLVRYVIQNLLSNAIKYSPTNSKVDLIVDEDNSNNLEIIVADKGIGIPEKDQAKLFEPFHRANNIGNISGTGLGLNIVKKAIEVQKGEITYKTKENVGTTFFVKIPKSNITIKNKKQL